MVTAHNGYALREYTLDYVAQFVNEMMGRCHERRYPYDVWIEIDGSDAIIDEIIQAALSASAFKLCLKVQQGNFVKPLLVFHLYVGGQAQDPEGNLQCFASLEEFYFHSLSLE